MTNDDHISPPDSAPSLNIPPGNLIRMLASILAGLLLGQATNSVPRINLTWPGDPATSISINWRSEQRLPNPSVILSREREREVVPAREEKVVINGKAGYFYSAVRRNLKPGGTYRYTAPGGLTGQFETALRDRGSFQWLYFGDAQNDIAEKWTPIVRAAYRAHPNAAFSLHAGDLINAAESDREWNEWFEAGRPMFSRMPLIATPGNHEFVGRIARQWRPQFEFPKNGPRGLEETCYFIDYQGLRIVSLDSNQRLEEQAAWLDAVLARNPQPWTVVTFHHPIYSGAIRRDNPIHRRLWAPIFDKHGVDLVLQGHDHCYTRTPMLRSGKEATPGTVYIVSVSGPKMYDLKSTMQAPTAVQFERTQVYQVIDTSPTELRYVSKTAEGKVMDEFVIGRDPGGRKRLIAAAVRR